MFKRLKNYVISVYQNYFEIASCLGATLIILLAILMDNILGLQACPMCMMTRYIFGIIAVIAFFGFIAKKLFLIDKFLIIFISLIPLFLAVSIFVADFCMFDFIFNKFRKRFILSFTNIYEFRKSH